MQIDREVSERGKGRKGVRNEGRDETAERTGEKAWTE